MDAPDKQGDSASREGKREAVYSFLPPDFFRASKARAAVRTALDTLLLFSSMARSLSLIRGTKLTAMPTGQRGLCTRAWAITGFLVHSLFMPILRSTSSDRFVDF